MVKKIVEEVADHVDQGFDIFLACEIEGIRNVVRPNRTIKESAAPVNFVEPYLAEVKS